ncbi:hypothetical protein SAMN02745244_03307 [Tessaracoccus bendigoensis DSM 12906]|uniref:Uncharacterized protein n=1 Tax=Tessaracoccus bendigoensis DSM 12906 TaxID=1123357 RepID=A0A1M6MBB0_9ACTN|nr:hypothetical protein [Tessaracoccus bendigoensis]SHJ80695.1 hypothetical protein SAMN02745244_03307 [Tessaracoccus bendigoensis DSM 12906]
MLITAADVAMIARVRRPVVTMWRKRYADAFPSAIDGRFDADLVVAWLTAHGRGNNPEPTRSLPMIELLVEARADVARAMELSAVLALRQAYGEMLVDDLAAPGPSGLTGRIAALDRLDCFGPEVLDLGDDLPRAAAAVDAFVDERFGAADAMGWLTNDCLVRHLPEFTAAALSPEASGLVSRSAVSLAEATARPGILDAAGVGFAWLQRLPPEWPQPVGLLRDESAVGRHSRRVVQVGEWDARVTMDERGWAVAVDTVLDADAAALFARAALGDDDQIRLVVGPARHLTDSDGATAPRDDLLRDGVVRAVVKLPAGCRPAHPREALALWVVAERDDTPFEQHRTYVADLTGAGLTQALIADLVDDLTVAAGDVASQQHRAWRVLRPVLTRHLLARGGSLVANASARPVKQLARPTLEALHGMAVDLGVGPLRLAPGRGPARTASSVQAGITEGWLRLIPGVRLALDQFGDGDLTVWSTDDGRLTRTSGVDRLTALAGPRTWLTRPGDVIFGPGPCAVVDPDGGSLVVTPARALRLADAAPVTAGQLARAVEASPRGTKPPQWRLTPLDPRQCAALSDAAARIGQRRAELTAQLDALNSFEDALLDACETNTITLETD